MSDHEPACTGSKRCARCGEEKAVLAFAVNRKAADGLQSYCRECQGSVNSRYRAEARQRTAEKNWTLSHHRKPPA